MNFGNNRFGDLPEWSGEPEEYEPGSRRVTETEIVRSELTKSTALELALVLQQAGMYDPVFELQNQVLFGF